VHRGAPITAERDMADASMAAEVGSICRGLISLPRASDQDHEKSANDHGPDAA